jgi:uncharacterized protein (TIGR03067 family)
MRYHAFIVFPVAAVFLASSSLGGGDIKAKAARAAAMKQELKRLAGTWELVHWGRDGQLLDRSEWKRLLGKSTVRITFLEGGFSGVLNSTNGRRSRYVLDPTTAPKTWDCYFPLDNGGEELVSVGIYEFEGDELTMCTGSPLLPRPTDFTLKRGSRHTYQIFRRVKDKQ